MLSTLPKWAVFLVVLAAVAGGLLLTGPLAAVLLGLVAVLLGWLAYLAWPQLRPGQRAMRALTVLLVLAAAASRWTA